MKLQSEIKPKIEKAMSLLKEVLNRIEEQRINNNIASIISKTETDRAYKGLKREMDKQKT